TTLGATLVAINLMAIRARVVELLADIDEGFEVSRLRCTPGELSNRNEFGHELLPICPIYRNGPVVLTSPSGRQQKRCCFRERNGSLINRQPSRINSGSPLDIIKRCSAWLLLGLIRGVLDLNVEYDVRIGESDGS